MWIIEGLPMVGDGGFGKSYEVMRFHISSRNMNHCDPCHILLTAHKMK